MAEDVQLAAVEALVDVGVVGVGFVGVRHSGVAKMKQEDEPKARAACDIAIFVFRFSIYFPICSLSAYRFIGAGILWSIYLVPLLSFI